MHEAVEPSRRESGRISETIGVGREEEQVAAVIDRPGPEDVDARRFAELERKRDAEGLTDSEANELGRMIAAKEGKPYSNAGAREHPDAGPRPESAPTTPDAEPNPLGARAVPQEEKPREEEARDLAR